MTTITEDSLEAENIALRELLGQARLDVSRLLAQAGINATETGVQNEKIGAISLSRLDQDGKTGSLAATDLRRFVSATVAPTCCRALILNQRG